METIPQKGRKVKVYLEKRDPVISPQETKYKLKSETAFSKNLRPTNRTAELTQPTINGHIVKPG